MKYKVKGETLRQHFSSSPSASLIKTMALKTIASKRPRPLDDPPAASSSSEEPEQSEQSEQEEQVDDEKQQAEESEQEDQESESEQEEEQESEESEDDENDQKKKKLNQITSPITKNKNNNNNPDDENEETDDESDESDDDGSQKSPKASDFTIKPITQKAKSGKGEGETTPVSKPAKKSSNAAGGKQQPQQPPLSKKAKRLEADTKLQPTTTTNSSGVNRLWKEPDEIAILNGLIEFGKKGKDYSSKQDEFHEFLKKSLTVEVSKSQLMDKIRRLKKKYKNNVDKGKKNGYGGDVEPVISKPHELQSFRLSNQIWGDLSLSDKSKSSSKVAVVVDNDGDHDISKSNNVRATRSAKKSSGDGKVNAGVVSVDMDVDDNGDGDGDGDDTGLAEKEDDLVKGKGEKVELSERKEKDKEMEMEKEEDFAKLYPFLMNAFRSDYMNNSLSNSGMDVVKSNLRLLGSSELKELDGKWKKYSMGEAELLLTRLDLMREEARMALDAMKNSES